MLEARVTQKVFLHTLSFNIIKDGIIKTYFLYYSKYPYRRDSELAKAMKSHRMA